MQLQVEELFRRATDHTPFPYQTRFALELPSVLQVPTGAGKTATTILGWLWRRRFADEAIRSQTPRRLVYCLPMRVLVEQTYSVALTWITKLNLESEVRVHLLMGDEDEQDWDQHPEQDAILIGTQDMLLSRALNRGYGMSRYRWPLRFGLLNNDCLWVVDEIQLMGDGLGTTTQLQAFRRLLGTYGPARTVWMSATLQPDWLRSVDVTDRDISEVFSLGPDDGTHAGLSARLNARKRLSRAGARSGDDKTLVEEIISDQAGRRRRRSDANCMWACVGMDATNRCGLKK